MQKRPCTNLWVGWLKRKFPVTEPWDREKYGDFFYTIEFERACRNAGPRVRCVDWHKKQLASKTQEWKAATSHCTRLIEAFQCAGDEKHPKAGCGFTWLSVPWKSLPDNCWCPNCGNHSAWDVDLEFLLCEESCVSEKDMISSCKS